MASNTQLEFLINHITLPPKLPNSRDAYNLNTSFLEFVYERAKEYHDLVTKKFLKSEWARILRMLSTWKDVATGSDGYSKQSLEIAVAKLSPGDFFALHIRAQNAGIMIEVTENQAVFESFEAVPKASAVVECHGRLACTYPSRAISVPINLLSEGPFMTQLLATLIDLDFTARSASNGQSLDLRSADIEDFDAANPKLVSSMLMAILAAHGQPIDPLPISKNIRDEVNGRYSKLPWRRSSLWAVIRVTVQLALSRMALRDGLQSEYKNFMLFLMSRLNEMAVTQQVSGPLLYHINAKLARRFEKLTKAASLRSFVRDAVLSSMRSNEELLSFRWESIQKRNEKTLPTMGLQPSPGDIQLKLSKSRNHLEKVLARDTKVATAAKSSLTPCMRLQAERWKNSDLQMPLTCSFKSNNISLVLMDFEDWVEKNICAIPSSRDACVTLSKLSAEYKLKAMESYVGLPERLSIMILTLLEVWVRVDQMVTEFFPLMLEYPPEIPVTLLHPLLLPKLSHLRRLEAIETHLWSRHARTSKGFPSHFSLPSLHSFAVAYCKKSARHEDLLNKIFETAKSKKSAKIQEYQKLAHEYRNLLTEASSMMHTCINIVDKITASSCSACNLRKQLKEIKITTHDWPLPALHHEQYMMIFEIACPLEYTVWRDFTWSIIQDLGRMESRAKSKSRNHYSVLTDDTLSTYVESQNQRISLASTVPAYHRKLVHISTPLSQVVREYRPRYRLYDSASNLWVERQKYPPDLNSFCKTPLPDGDYADLQDTVNGTSHSQNQIIARHGECPAALRIHEYDSFGSLRAGERLQWPNILLALCGSDLTLNTEAVCTLITQAVWQVGSAKQDETYRASHGFLKDETFVTCILDKTEAIAASIEANWNEEYSMTILVILLSRVVSLSTTPRLQQRALKQLRNLRKTTIHWIRNTIAMQPNQRVPREFPSLERRILRISTLCRMTFDVNEKFIEEILADSDDFATFIECTASICTRTPADWRSSMEGETLRRVERDRNLAHRLEPFVRHRALSHNKFMDEAILRIWPDYTRGTESWSLPLGDRQPWVRTSTLVSSTRKSQTVDFNYLDGQFLVDGAPVGKLPRRYTKHKEYQRIFGQQVLQVIASNMPSMLYMTAIKLHGYQFYFASENDSKSLVIRAKMADKIYEVVPHGHFEEEIPSLFVEEYVHWMNIKTSELEFRPLESMFQSSTDNPFLSFSTEVSIINFSGQCLLDFESNMGIKLTKIFSGFEDRKYLHMYLSASKQIEVFLPRFNLSFFVNKDQKLESLDLSAVIDQDQSLGTFIGLQSHLVIRQKSVTCDAQNRSVLVSFGQPSVSPDGDHVMVKVSLENRRKAQYFRYYVDPVLNRLRTPANLEARLFQAHLHGLTSYALPDPFTGRTGTEESLYCLRQPAMRAFVPLNDHCYEVLQNISLLTPVRDYGPSSANKKTQETQWDPVLSPLSQHEEYLLLVNNLIRHSNDLAIVQCEHDNPTLLEIFERGELNLLNKAASQNANFRNSDFGGTLGSNDKPYKASDSANEWHKSSLQAYELAYCMRAMSKNIGLSLKSECVEKHFEKFTIMNFPITTKALEPLPSCLVGLNIVTSWARLYDLCRSTTSPNDKCRIQFLLSILAFHEAESTGSDINFNLLKLLLAINLSGQLASEKLPVHVCFDLKDGFSPNLHTIEKLLERNVASSTTQTTKQVIIHQSKTLAKHLLSQWPCAKPEATHQPQWARINIENAISDCRTQFRKWYANKQFFEHISRVKTAVDSFQEALTIPFLQYIPNNTPLTSNRAVTAPFIHDMFSGTPLEVPSPEILTVPGGKTSTRFGSAQQSQLRKLAAKFVHGANSTERAYGHNMNSSLDALSQHLDEQTPRTVPIPFETILRHRDDCLKQVLDMFMDMQGTCGFTSVETEHLRLGKLMPQFTPTTVLRLISTATSVQIPAVWRGRIVEYGIALTMLQRADRMVRLALEDDITSFYTEARNIGHQGWDVLECTDCLLMEIEGNSLIRPVQIDVARNMLAPSGNNSVTQLNMGEGKSSWIIPLVAVALANGQYLSRVIVPKPLIKPMGAILSERLGGLVNRSVYFTPFSRQTKLDNETQTKLFGMWEECRTSRGVVLAQPEHILSFKLIGLEKLCMKENQTALRLLEWQLKLQKCARNILDESDEIMDPREQLIYTVGIQQPFDGSADRWQTSQRILGQIIPYLSDRAQHHHSGSFPVFHIDSEELEEVLSSIIDDISHSMFPGLNLGRHDTLTRKAVLRFIKKRESSALDQKLIFKHFQGSEMERILVLRGLFAFGIMSNSLSKRWSVEYGLTSNRKPDCLVAVPYQAKSCPSRSSEFGHPEVMIILTCLSYYYTGLTDDQLAVCFSELMKSNDPSLEYSTWSRACACMPEKFQSLSGVNLDDNDQCRTKLFPHLEYNKATIDFFLTSIVFPSHCKQFPEKLSSCSWDIPGDVNADCPPTTGFSGTNDSRYLLPLSISQEDSPGLSHTSAMVMSQLIRDSNRKYICAQSLDEKRLSENELIALIADQTPKLSVIVDVGAQFLGMGNREVALTWLSIENEAEAAVFFDENDEVMVIGRSGQAEMLVSSKFQDSLERCVIYLDQSHTRGVDLRFSKTARAAVTLGQNLTKDRLVQGCMRMRKLNEDQSVLFFAPPEIDRDIRRVVKKDPDEIIDSRDVLEWSLEQTMEYLRRNQPLWVVQGLNHSTRRLAEDTFMSSGLSDALENIERTEKYINVIQEKDAQTLKSMYLTSEPSIIRKYAHHTADDTIRKLVEVGIEVGKESLKISGVEEQQEKEVFQEKEQEVHVERPLMRNALQHHLQPKLRRYIQTGDMAHISDKNLFPHAYELFRRTSAAPYIPNRQTGNSISGLLMTRDFSTTVAALPDENIDNYLRPVNFILSKTYESRIQLVVISPFEANELLEETRLSKEVTMHIYNPKVTRSMSFMDDLGYYAISGLQSLRAPIGIPRELNIFAGQLYFRNAAQYKELLLFLEILPMKTERSEGVSGKEKVNDIDPSRLAFLRTVVAIRRKGQDASRTPVGRIMEGEKLPDDAFDF